MKILLSAMVAAALAAATFPAVSQTNDAKTGMQGTEHNAPGTGGTSKPGVSGMQGNKSGPAPSVTVGEGAATKTPGGYEKPSTGATSNATKQQDQSGVAGMPGSKSGPAVKPPSK